jgi:hypothetical protein
VSHREAGDAFTVPPDADPADVGGEHAQPDAHRQRGLAALRPRPLRGWPAGCGRRATDRAAAAIRRGAPGGRRDA